MPTTIMGGGTDLLTWDVLEKRWKWFATFRDSRDAGWVGEYIRDNGRAVLIRPEDAPASMDVGSES